MSRREYVTVLLAAIIAGTCGGLIGGQFFGDTPVYAQKKPGPRPFLEAQNIVLVDEAGTTRAMLFLDTNGEPRFSLLSKDGKPRATLMIKNDEASLNLYAKGGAQESVLTDSLLTFKESNNKPRIALSLLPDGKPGLVFTDTNQQPIWSAP
jgi:hypothetical protein